MESNYIVAGARIWNKRVFNETIVFYPGRWHFVSTPDELSLETVAAINPRYIFFLHWSWKVLNEIFNNYECVCFHMTDVPYGRGGSPLQNMIIRGHHHTKLTALRMIEDFDAGPVYLKKSLSLDGNAEEIYIRACYLSAQMILHIIEEQPVPAPQVDKPVIFERRKPHESKIPEVDNLQSLYDFIRMLDADGYPRAFIEYRGFRYEFSRASLYDGRVTTDVNITPTDGDAS